MNNRNGREPPWWLLVLVLGVCFVGIVDRDLWTPDEPRVAAISVEMARTGNVVVPLLAGEPFLEKPPLYFAVAGLTERTVSGIFGSVGAIRLTTALWGLGVLCMLYILARRLGAGVLAGYAVLLLATSVGFVVNMHWIRVDAAMAFFVIAALACFGEVFVADRKWFCLPAGLCTAGAFLSKGPIGLIFIAMGWAALAVPRWGLQIQEKQKREFYILPHLLALAVLLLVAGTWMVLLRRIGGEELWHEWFWDNQVGRLLGKVPALGHRHPGQWWYYLQSVAIYTLPWLPVLLAGLWRIVDRGVKRVRAGSAREWLLSPGFFALAWGAGSIAVLTLSVTKREMYLLPVLPAFAMICAEGLRDPMPRWCSGFYRFWLWLCAVALLALVVSPLVLTILPDSLTGQVPVFLMGWSLRHTLVAVAGAGAFWLVLRSPLALGIRVIASSALVIIAFFLVPGEAVNQHKSMEVGYRAFAKQVPVEARSRTVAWKFTETTRAGLVFYGGMVLTNRVEDERALAILQGRDADFDSVVLAWRDGLDQLDLPPHEVLVETRPGSGRHPRTLYWMKGKTTE